MKIYLKEKIGNPELFTGRKKEMDYLLNWISRIKREISNSTAILSRRKTGKSALLQRLYNITFDKNDGVIPFYFEIKEFDQWLGSFAERYFRTFIFQYLAFKLRRPEYVEYEEKGSLEKAADVARQESLDYILMFIDEAQKHINSGDADMLWETVRDAPRLIAGHYDERVVQMIDEFQYINRFIFRDRACTRCIDNLAGSYFHTVEYRNAPMLISGSWVGWLMHDLGNMLPGRLQKRHLEDLPQDESIEMIYRYSLLEDIPVTEKSAYLMSGLTEGSPFYISGLFRSAYPDKDLTSEAGVLATLEFEILHEDGNIRGTWLEYIESALPRINERYAKDIVLYLSKHRDRLITRQELMRELKLDMSDGELRKKLKALLRCDIIEESYFKYRGVQDNVFDKIFRSEYGHDIEAFVPQGMRDEYKAMFEKLKSKYNSLSGDYNRYKGAYAEFMIIHHLRFMAYQNNELYRSMMQNLPADFEFIEYESVWPYHSPPLHEPQFQVDIFAKAKPGGVSLIGEVKHRQTTKFSLQEAQAFQVKVAELVRLEQVEDYTLFVFSTAGFQEDLFDYFKEYHIAWSDDARWLDRG
jgi:hypothetical protein